MLGLMNIKIITTAMVSHAIHLGQKIFMNMMKKNLVNKQEKNWI